MFLDTDRNPSTCLLRRGLPHPGLQHRGSDAASQLGSVYEVYAPASFSGSFSGGVLEARVSLSDVGAPLVFDHFSGSLHESHAYAISLRTWGWARPPSTCAIPTPTRSSDSDDPCPTDRCRAVTTRTTTAARARSTGWLDRARYRWEAAVGGVTLTFGCDARPGPNGSKVVARVGLASADADEEARPPARGPLRRTLPRFGDVITVRSRSEGWIGW